jgi:hypothetical protein
LEALKNNTVGYAIAALGAVVALAGGLADTLGIGADGADGLGGKQLAALLVGLVILAAGLAVVFLSGQDAESAETGAAEAADTVADTEPAAGSTADADADAEVATAADTESADAD